MVEYYTMPLLAAPLDELVATRPKLAILRALYGRTTPVSARELARQVRISHPTILLALNDLTARGIVIDDGGDAGRVRLCRLNQHHALVRSVLPALFDAERRWGAELTAALRAVLVPRSGTSDVVAASIFGSVARGTDQATSDLDLLILARDRRAATRVRAAVADAQADLRARFGITVAPVVLSVTEARRRFARGDTLLKAAARDTRMVAGNEDLAEVLRGPADE